MKTYTLLENIDYVCFGGKGLSLSGSPCLLLPGQLTLDHLKYPRRTVFTNLRLYNMCLTWNPMQGKKQVLGALTGAPNLNKPMSDRTTYDTWTLSKLVHILNADGIPVNEVSEIKIEDGSYVFWLWHFVVSTYPEMLFPSCTDKLFPKLQGSIMDKNMQQVKEGFRDLVKSLMWVQYTRFDFDYLKKMFGSSKYRGEFLSTKNEFLQYSLNLQDLVQENVEKTGLTAITSKFNRNLTLYLCLSHTKALKNKDCLGDVPTELYGPYSVFISFVDLGSNDITVIPEAFLKALPNVVDLKLCFNFIDVLPGTIKYCKKLATLLIHENNLAELPEEMAELEHLRVLEIGGNRFAEFPPVVTKLKNLQTLTMQNMCLKEIPEDIGELKLLKVLHLHGNCLTRLPKSFTDLQNLEELFLSGVQWAGLGASKDNMTFANFKYSVRKKFSRWLSENGQDQTELFRMFDKNHNGVLEAEELGRLNAAVFNLFPRFGYKGKDPPDDSTPHGFPMEVFSCKNLRLLYVNHQGITKIPAEIGQLVNLIELQVAHSPNLLSIAAELSEIKNMKRLELDDCPLLKTPPREIREKGMTSVMAYLQRLMGGALLSKRTKLMLVGLGGAGKTSLVKALLSSDDKAELLKGEEITDGIEIKTWQVKHEEDLVTYNIWDFAGQTVYYNTHQFFLSPNRAIYLLLWNVRLGHEHAGLDFWLSSISVQAPKTPIFVVGSHIDQVSKTELHVEELQLRFPQIVGFHFISSYTGQGISDLKKRLLEVTLQQQYMGEHIPAVWLTFENNIEKIKKKEQTLPYKRIEEIANESGIFEPSEVYQAVQFLHDLGSVQHFSNEYLKSRVVINPQWIVDVMACVVSVKNNVIKDGRLNHNDLAQIWSDYPKSLHRWLLRLTEEFNLSFELVDEPVSLVPCLMSERKPTFEWPELDRTMDIRETKMVYLFDYLPAGLFNRAQVRLHQLSDSALIWKKGSFLKKNVHLALLQQTKDTELVVLSQGPRPENIQFLVHEVFEGLIAESFNGVTYDFTMPCPDCQKMGVTDMHMFSASTIRRALDMKAPFLQCIKYFHTVSCSLLQTLLPPDSHGDFDVHLVQCVQGLKDLHKDLAADIFISYCEADGRLDKNMFIHPPKVHEELKNKGYKCFHHVKDNIMSTDEMAKALIDSSVFLAFVSVNYAQDDDCVNIFKYARLTLKKTIVVVAIGDNFDWRQSKLGILLADEVFINMTKAKFEHFDSKFEELLNTLSGKTRLVSDMAPKPAVFFSYTWVNSEQAVMLGTKELPGALGYGDPRELKTYLEEHGLNCWIDVERVGMNGLFDDIAEGLLSAKVVVVCVSDEYAASPTCQIEFRYAANTLKLPFIVAVVGTGDTWRATEVGLMSVYYPIVNFQEKTKGAKKKLLSLVQAKLSEVVDMPDGVVNKDSGPGNKDLSYQELYELAQRKLLRQLAMYEENQDMDVYPRLFVVDFASSQDTTAGESTDEEIHEIPPTEKKKKLVRRPTSSLIPMYRLQKYCVYTLCEHEEGWHSVATPLMLPSNFGMDGLDMFCPFLSRMTTIMKYNKKLPLQCLSDEAGEGYLEWLEKSPEASMSDYQMVYHRFRELIQSLDEEQSMGKLQRCHLTNGKTIWLCDHHRNSMKVTLLSNDDKTSHMIKEQEEKLNEWMLMGLRSMDYAAFEGEFQTKGLAKRPIQEMSKYNRNKDIKGDCTKTKHQHKHKGKQKKADAADGNDDNAADNRGNKETTESEMGGEKPTTAKSDSATGADKKQPITRLESEDGVSVTSEVTTLSPPTSGKMRHKQQQEKRPLPGQSRYKVPGYKQTSRACEIS